MMFPDEIVSANPIRQTESKQGYAIRLLNIAYAHVTDGAYTQCLAIIQRHAAGTTGNTEDAFSNVLIDIHNKKLSVIEQLKREAK